MYDEETQFEDDLLKVGFLNLVVVLDATIASTKYNAGSTEYNHF